MTTTDEPGEARWSPFSGRQVEIRSGEQRAVVVEVGGGLREYEVDGQAVLDGYAIDSMAMGGRALPLMPWPNRLADGKYTFDGRPFQLPINELARNNASHGFVSSLNWTVAHQAPDRVTMEVTLFPRQGYPFALELSIEYVLTSTGLTVRTKAHNFGKTALPFGAGQHPYFTVGTPLVDSATLVFGARSRLELDAERRLPTGQLLPVADSGFDFLEPRLIGDRLLDDCFGDLDRDASGVARVVLADPRTGRAVSVWMDQTYKYVQIFSGDTLPPHDRRHSLAIEPMTCPPNALQTGLDLIVLQPGESRVLEFGVSSDRGR